jgi:hypothetical protein
MDAQKYEMMQEKMEFLADVHSSLSQIENGQGVDHKDAMDRVLKRIGKLTSSGLRWISTGHLGFKGLSMLK